MDQDPAAPPPPAANNQDADIGQVAAAMQAATEVFNAPATSIEGTPTPQPPQLQDAVPSTETPPIAAAAPASSAAPPQSTTAAAAQPATTASPAPASPAPGRTGTPMRNMAGGGGGGETGSRAASLHPEPSFNMPTEAATHGAPARVYLNTKVTGVLLEGMKIIAKDQPNDPLRVLGEFLLQRSKDIESSG